MIVEKFDTLKQGPWECLAIENLTLSPRFLMGSCVVSEKHIVLFGGFNDGFLDESVVISLEKLEMHQISSVLKSDYFFQRVSTVKDGMMYIIGNRKPFEVHSLDLNLMKWEVESFEKVE
jgi:hypothetical protein